MSWRTDFLRRLRLVALLSFFSAGAAMAAATALSHLNQLDRAMFTADYKKALAILQKKQDKQSLYLQAMLYLDHRDGLGVEKKDADLKAEKLLMKAIAKGHKDALYVHALRFARGEKDKALEKAAKQGSAAAALYLGSAYYFGKRGKSRDYAQAKKYFTQAAGTGSAKASYYLGTMYELGKGVTKHPGQAAKWYRKAVRKGDFRAYLQLGRLLHEHKGSVKPANIMEKIAVRMYLKKYHEAIPKLKALARRGNARAQYILGTHYIAYQYKASRCGLAQSYLLKAMGKRQPGARERLKYIYSRYSVCKQQ